MLHGDRLWLDGSLDLSTEFTTRWDANPLPSISPPPSHLSHPPSLEFYLMGRERHHKMNPKMD